MTARVVEASAPCRVDLAGGSPGAVVVNVAIDRRALCRVETGVAGIEVESKDTLLKASGQELSEIPARGVLGLAARVLGELDVRTGVRVVMQSRVPAGAGLGEWSALAVAVAGATARACDREMDPVEIGRLAHRAVERAADPPSGIQDCHTAVHGGVLVLHPAPAGLRVSALAVDPARIEESLLLVESGGKTSPGERSGSEAAAVAERVQAALLAGRFEDVVGLWVEEWESRRARAGGSLAPETDRIAGIVHEAGGGVRACGAGEGSVLAVWAPPGSRGPGRREAVVAATKAAGLRLFSARVDLRGLEVE